MLTRTTKMAAVCALGNTCEKAYRMGATTLSEAHAEDFFGDRLKPMGVYGDLI
jgi:hypothetical protein